jgi:hypothetical protein
VNPTAFPADGRKDPGRHPMSIPYSCRTLPYRRSRNPCPVIGLLLWLKSIVMLASFVRLIILLDELVFPAAARKKLSRHSMSIPTKVPSCSLPSSDWSYCWSD